MSKKNKKDKILLPGNLVNVNDVIGKIEKTIKPFEYDATSITQLQYNNSVSVNAVAQPFEYMADYSNKSGDNVGVRLYYDKLYNQLDRTSSLTEQSFIMHGVLKMLSIFFALLDDDLKKNIQNQEVKNIILNSMYGTLNDENNYISTLPHVIYNRYLTTVVNNIEYTCTIAYSKNISSNDIQVYINPFIDLFSSNVVSEMATRLFNGIYNATIIYPGTFELFEQLNEGLVILFQELALNMHSYFTNITKMLIDKQIKALKIRRRMKHDKNEDIDF